jgi:hypothetical protein
MCLNRSEMLLGILGVMRGLTRFLIDVGIFSNEIIDSSQR